MANPKQAKKNATNNIEKKSEKGFREAFSSNKSAGKKEFTWNGKSYSTQTAQEKAKNLSDKDLFKASSNATRDRFKAIGVEGKPKSKSKQKSTKEIQKSYDKEISKRFNP